MLKKKKEGMSDMLIAGFVGIFSFLILGFGIWAAVEFIIYLVKDIPFNWLSVWFLGAAIGGEAFFLIKLILKED